MNGSVAWAAAFAFASMCAAIAWANVNWPQPPPRTSAQIECIKAKGRWIQDKGWFDTGTCEFKHAGAGQ